MPLFCYETPKGPFISLGVTGNFPQSCPLMLFYRSNNLEKISTWLSHAFQEKLGT